MNKGTSHKSRIIFTHVYITLHYSNKLRLSIPTSCRLTRSMSNGMTSNSKKLFSKTFYPFPWKPEILLNITCVFQRSNNNNFHIIEPILSKVVIVLLFQGY